MLHSAKGHSEGWGVRLSRAQDELFLYMRSMGFLPIGNTI